MAAFEFVDALAGCKLSFATATSNARLESLEGELAPCSDLFLPGCSMINYGLPLVQAVFDTLTTYGKATGVSLLCCGKILSYEPDGAALRDKYELEFIEHLAKAQVKRIVAACPNCVKALRGLCARDERTASIQIIPLARALADIGFRIPAQTAQALVAPEIPAGAAACFAPHDSCPDRAMGEFADAVRELLEGISVVEPEHSRKTSVCCGSLSRAAGKVDAAIKCAKLNGSEAVAAGANAIVTPCVSCTQRLMEDQDEVPVFHYLELLYNWRIDWKHMEQWMKIRFLFEGSYGVVPTDESSRSFIELPSSSN